jgi:hypothetical protein
VKISPNFTSVAASLIKAKMRIAQLPLIKDAQGDRAKYLKLNTLLSTVEPVLHEEGWMIVQGCGENITDGLLLAISIETTLLHTSGEWIQTTSVVPLVGAKKSKDERQKEGTATFPPDAQSGGGAQTYGRRYGLYAILSLAVADDDDGATASLRRRKKVSDFVSVQETGVKAGPWTQPGIMPWGSKKGTPMLEIAEPQLRAAMADARAKSGLDEAAVIEAELKRRAERKEPQPA